MHRLNLPRKIFLNWLSIYIINDMNTKEKIVTSQDKKVLRKSLDTGRIENIQDE